MSIPVPLLRKGVSKMRSRQKKTYTQITIRSWDEFVSIVGTGYLNWAFRGHSDADWQLETTLGRRFRTAGIDPRAWPEQESRILRIFKRKAHLFLDHIPHELDVLHWLATMQHHGAPTRLLDFSWSPYVAAFFALEFADRDAAIWAVNPAALRSPISLVVDGKKKSVKPFDLRLRREAMEDVDWNYRQNFLPNTHSFAILDEPNIMNQRTIAQSGTFIIPSTLNAPFDAIVGEYSNASDVLTKFILPTKKIRKAAMLALYTMNVTQYTLFPGIDGLARSMGYELEYNQFFNPVNMRPNPGYESDGDRLFDWSSRQSK